jgi:hypothetical protein
MLVALIVGAIVLFFGILAFIFIKLMILGLVVAGIVYGVTYVALDNLMGPERMAFSIFGAMIIGTLILWLISKAMEASSNRQVVSSQTQGNLTLNGSCPCGSGKPFKYCCYENRAHSSTSVNVVFCVLLTILAGIFSFGFYDFGFKIIGAIVAGLIMSSLATIIIFKVWRYTQR